MFVRGMTGRIFISAFIFNEIEKTEEIFLYVVVKKTIFTLKKKLLFYADDESTVELKWVLLLQVKSSLSEDTVYY